MKKVSKRRNGLVLPEEKGGKVKLENVYELYMGRRAGFSVWVVDWHFVTKNLYSAFLMGGNDQRYRFNPAGEVWIDSTMGIEEYEYTLGHEVLEQRMMHDFGWTYDRAHDFASDTLDVELRLENRQRIERKLKVLAQDEKFAPLVDKLGQVYRAYLGKRQGLHIWVVDGSRVREHIWQDFGFGGTHDLARPDFVPPGEVWLDSATSCGTLQYALVQELTFRQKMADGMEYSEAYMAGVVAREQERLRQAKRCRNHEAKLEPVPVGYRDRGVKCKDEE
jgi:hypothetical protein